MPATAGRFSLFRIRLDISLTLRLSIAKLSNGTCAMKHRYLTGVVAGFAILAGCAVGSGRFTHTDYTPAYTPSLVNYVGQAGYFPLETYGAPFGAKGNEDIAASLRLPGGYVDVPFKDITGQQTEDRGRLVLIMDPQRIPTQRNACGAPGRVKLAEKTGEQLIVVGNFCYQDELMTQTVLTMDRPAGADDPKLQGALRMMTELLFREDLPDGADCSSSAGDC